MGLWRSQYPFRRHSERANYQADFNGHSRTFISYSDYETTTLRSSSPLASDAAYFIDTFENNPTQVNGPPVLGSGVSWPLPLFSLLPSSVSERVVSGNPQRPFNVIAHSLCVAALSGTRKHNVQDSGSGLRPRIESSTQPMIQSEK
jgi:hypothetical protein